MAPDEYVKARVDDQIAYYDRQSTNSRKWHQSLTVVQIISGGLIPILSGFSAQIRYSEWIIALLGLAVTCATAFLSLNKYHERSINFRLTCEALKNVKYLFMTRVAPYKEESAFETFVGDVEKIISRETADWAAYSRKDQNKAATASAQS